MRFSKLLLLATALAGSASALRAHEAFLPLHEHYPSVGHGHAHSHGAPHERAATEGKHMRIEPAPEPGEHRFTFASGLRYTRLSVEGERAELWETAAGFDFAVLPWLHLGGEATYGWFDSEAGSADGWMSPSAHADLHLPIGGNWELIAGFGVGFPGGEEALVGEHWLWEPHLELRYDRGAWFVAAGVGLAILTGSGHQHEEAEAHAEHAEEEGEAHEEGEEAHAEEAHAHSHASGGDFHEIVDPHGERELEYYGAAGVRLLDQRLTLEGRLSGVRVLQGETPARDFLRIGARTALRLGKDVTLSAGGSVPITDARRSEWQAFISAGVAF